MQNKYKQSVVFGVATVAGGRRRQSTVLVVVVAHVVHGARASPK